VAMNSVQFEKKKYRLHLIFAYEFDVRKLNNDI